jgi:acyl-CoA reductase-like NAD-dependent aldehyde dehydrogenase
VGTDGNDRRITDWELHRGLNGTDSQLKGHECRKRKSPITSPIDGSVFAERPLATDAAVNAAVERAKGAQVRWAATPVANAEHMR